MHKPNFLKVGDRVRLKQFPKRVGTVLGMGETDKNGEKLRPLVLFDTDDWSGFYYWSSFYFGDLEKIEQQGEKNEEL